jgi:hypothetical protein
MTQGNEVAARETGQEVAVYDPGEDAGLGMQNVTMDERRIPFLRILDPKSPQCKPPNAGGIPGARGGSMFNTSTGQVYDGEKGVFFVPTSRDHKFVEYITRNEDGSGGGFVGVHEPDEPLVLQLRAQHGRFGKLPVPNTTPPQELVETFSLYGIVITPDGEQFRCIVGFSSTQIKKYTGFIDRYDNIQYDGPNGRIKPALWAHRWHLKTTYEQKGGNSWYGWVITLAEKNPDGSEAPPIKSRLSLKDPLYIAGKDFYNLIVAGAAKADYAKQAPDAQANDDDNEIPL